ncbi:cupin domain-containing protein [Paenibacillus aceris]|uniref:Cupin superfamily sugar epimerase n=1 Tax=Paenibacillus aceris TaxID=869555 RepID=A0ABS4HYA6_9BACL|nr:cupin domain-containing protein [Paenibacillus aceris]MBP1963555.1 putative cupin superfamily sugar epimerase [Paenibacillus aceris]NHW36819.1 cupin domain-containing protein [Paenibacillus aceris]
MKTNSPEYWISKLELVAHPEGGYYKRTFQAEETITDQELSVQFNGSRLLYTSIYFLLQSHDVSHFHRLKSDELWYYHAGSPLTIHVILEDGTYEEVKLGINLENGETPQYLVPKNSIFGSSVMVKNTFSLVGCMVAPGFDFQDFEMFTQEELLGQYPQHREVIMKLAYELLPV